jgi:hypothetical protein
MDGRDRWMAPTEAGMPRFVGKRSVPWWWNVLALIALVIIIIVVLQLAGAIDLGG